MRVKLDCEAKYVAEEDPWGIGQADSARYDLYVETIRDHARARGSLLDIGCGFGAMLARLAPDFDRLHGIELSADAIAKGAARYPFIDFERGSIDALKRTRADRERFDAIVFSDVLYYVEEADKRSSLRWIAEHLHRDHGFAFIALYCPGGSEYPTAEEVRTLVAREFAIKRESLLDSGHLMLLARPRRRFAALTLDYETWQPVPAGRRIDWDTDVFEPTDALLDACDAEGARLTIFAELGEHAYLREHEPGLAVRMEAQWRDAVRRGHDVQVHLHPNWLPELGARSDCGRYIWNELLTRAEDHPDLVGLIARLKQTLQEVIRPIDPAYEVVAFRAGGYEAQPFRRLAEALRANDMWCDSSVYHGGRQPGMYHDYAHPFDAHQPWFASHVDPQLLAPPAERGIVELPVATFARNDRWTFDTEEGARFGERLVAAIEAERTGGPSVAVARALASARRLGGSAYDVARAVRPLVNKALPRRIAHALVEYPGACLPDDGFYVAVGHSKADLDVPAIRGQLRVLREAGVEVIGLAEMAHVAREQLERYRHFDAEGDTCARAGGAHAWASCDDSDDPRSRRLRAMVPLDRARVLVLGQDPGGPSARVAPEHPPVQVTRVDAVGGRLPFADGTFDCVYADDAFGGAPDVDAALGEAWRVLVDDGALIAAVSPDAYDTRRANDAHAWKTSAADVRERLRHAGFCDVSIDDADAYRLGATPYPPASDRVLYVRAWRRRTSHAPVDRVDALRRWVHERHEPGQARTPVLGEALVRDGFEPRLTTMIAHGHPHGSGPCLRLTHEVIELTLPDHSVHVLDAVAGVRFPHTLEALIDDATLADGVDRTRDREYMARGYDLYSTSFWYRRVVAVAVRDRACGRRRFVPARWAGVATQPKYQALALMRVHGWRAIRRLRPM
jgi:SAM-dependent methyltransferase